MCAFVRVRRVLSRCAACRVWLPHRRKRGLPGLPTAAEQAAILEESTHAEDDESKLNADDDIDPLDLKPVTAADVERFALPEVAMSNAGTCGSERRWWVAFGGGSGGVASGPIYNARGVGVAASCPWRGCACHGVAGPSGVPVPRSRSWFFDWG